MGIPYRAPGILGNLEGLRKKGLSSSGYSQENKQEGAKETSELKERSEWLALKDNMAEPENQTGLRDTLLEKSTVLCGQQFRRTDRQKRVLQSKQDTLLG